ncbi:MAG: TolC family protein [Flavobacteriales bacterium]|nr:TolC family protein [Flavobacteriales bacterium]
MRLNPFILSLLCIISFSINAQADWSLDSCIAHAVKDNIQVKLSELEAQRAKYQLEQSKWDLLPNLNGNMSNSYNIGKRIDPFTNTFASKSVRSNNFNLSSGVNLFNGLSSYNTIKKNSYDLRASTYNTEVIKNNISLNIAALFLQILLNKELVGVQQEQLLQSKGQLKRITKLVEAGVQTQSDIANIESQNALEELNLISAENNLSLSYLELKQLLDISTKDNFSIVTPDLSQVSTDVLDFSAEMIYERASKDYPTIKMSEEQLLSRETALIIAKAGYVPSLSLNGSIGTGYSGADQVLIDEQLGTFQVKSFNNQFKDNVYKYVGLSLSVPIFNQFTIRNSVRNAELNVESQKLSIELEKNNLEKTISTSHANAVAALKKYKVSGKAVIALKEAFRNTSVKYNQGMVDFIEYSNAKSNLTRTESELLQSKFDYIFKIKILDFYQGRPLKL